MYEGRVYPARIGCRDGKTEQPHWILHAHTTLQLRVLLHQCCVASLEPGVILDAVLDYLEDHNSNMDALWSGKAHAIDTNDTGAVAVMHVLVDRWLLEFE